MVVAISKTDLARNTREIVDQVRQGHTLVVQSYGEDQIILLDPLDYHILLSVVDYALTPDTESTDSNVNKTMRLYLSEEISLAKAAEMLGVSRFDLMERFERLGIPLRLGPATLTEALEEVDAIRQVKPSS